MFALITRKLLSVFNEDICIVQCLRRGQWIFLACTYCRMMSN